jgi:SPP1 family predicted phage head-tail adaptor
MDWKMIAMAMPKTVNYRPYLFNELAQFGTVSTETNRHTGMQVPSFVKKFSLHVYPQKTTLNRLYLQSGTQYEDTITLVITHNTAVNDQLKVKYRDVMYKIVNISSDDSSNYQTYDFLSLQKLKRVGNNA